MPGDLVSTRLRIGKTKNPFCLSRGLLDLESNRKLNPNLDDPFPVQSRRSGGEDRSRAGHRAVRLLPDIFLGRDSDGRLGLVRCVDERYLTPARLAAAVDAELTGQRPREGAIAVDGAERSANMIAGWAERGDE